MTSRRVRILVLGLLAAAISLVTAAPAMAACHVAAFIDDQVVAGEADGTVVLTVELQGRVSSCEGTVDVATVDDSATVGSDYEALTTTLTFVAGDDREESVEIVLLDDDEAEGEESFRVELSNTTGSIQSTGGAGVVTVTDDDAATSTDEPTAPDADPTDAPDDDATTTAVPDDDAEDGDEGEDDAGDDEDGADVLLIAVIVLAVLGGVGFLARRGRAG